MAERTCERCGGPYTVWDGCLNLGCNPAHEETRSRLAEVTAERDALVEGVQYALNLASASWPYISADYLRALLSRTPEQEDGQ